MKGSRYYVNTLLPRDARFETALLKFAPSMALNAYPNPPNTLVMKGYYQKHKFKATSASLVIKMHKGMKIELVTVPIEVEVALELWDAIAEYWIAKTDDVVERLIQVTNKLIATEIRNK